MKKENHKKIKKASDCDEEEDIFVTSWKRMALNKNIYKIRGAPYKIWKRFFFLFFFCFRCFLVVDRKKSTAMVERETTNKLNWEVGKSNKESFSPNNWKKKTISHGFCIQFWVIKVERFMVYPRFLFYRLFTFIFNLLFSEEELEKKNC